MPVPKRPRGVPAEAVWSEEEKEWVLGQLVDGKRHGTFRFWRPDGTLCCESTFEHGEAHGPFRRFHQNRQVSQQGCFEHDRRAGQIVWQRSTGRSTEVTLPPQAGDNVWKACSHVEDGIVKRQEFFTKDGQPVTLQGLPIPSRPEGVPEEALYDSVEQYWQHGLFEDMTGTPIGIQREWNSSGVLWAQSEWQAGEKVLERAFGDDGRLRLEHRYKDGDWVLKREYDDVGHLREEHDLRGEDGRRRQFYASGKVRVEWREEGGAVTRTDYYEGGERLASHEPRGEESYWRTEYFPGGAKRAEGEFDEEALGVWTTHDESGALLGQTDFSTLAFSPGERVFELAELLVRWQELPSSPLLEGVEQVGWDDLDPFNGDGDSIPLYLRGLTAEDDRIFTAALAQLTDALLEQQAVSDPAGPTAPFLVRLIAEGPPQRRVKLMGLLLDMLTREGEISSAFEIKNAVARVPEDADPLEYLPDEKEIEGAYHQLVHAVSDHADLWARWMVEEEEVEVRRRAARLLPFALDERRDRARQQVVAAIERASDRVIVGDLTLALVLLQPITEDSEARRVLGRLLSGDDPVLRLCAALTTFRLPEVETPEEALQTVVEVLGKPTAPGEGLSQLYFAGLDPTSDASDALSSLAPGLAAAYLPMMASAAMGMDGVGSFGISRAMLDIAFPEGYDGERLNRIQRAVLQTVVQTESVWTFTVDMREVLSANNLPADRLELKRMADRG